MKKLSLLSLAFIATTALWAADFTVDNIAYNILGGDSVEVTSKDPKYSDSITIPATVTYKSTTYRVTSIGIFAFYRCESLTSITIPNSVTSIGDDAFYYCTSLTSINIPNGVTSIGYRAFEDCESLTSINTDPANTHYASLDGVLFNYAKDTLIQYPIGNTRTEYTIPNSVTTIGGHAFEGCTSLTSINLPYSVKSIGYHAFCSLTSIDVDAANTRYASIDGVLFNYAKDTLIQCPSGKKGTIYAIPNSVISIGEEAFHNCKSLTSITIPNSVTSIGYRAFDGCTSLTSITIPNSVTSIGNDAFWACLSLPIENNLRYADTYLVAAVDQDLSTYTIKEGTKWIGNGAFNNCESLTSITIPSNVINIGDMAFYNCLSLTSIDVNPANTHYTSTDGVLFNYAKDTLIQYPAGNTRTEYTIPNSVTSFGFGAFRGCTSLCSVTIPNSVTKIGEQAFIGCTKLTSITIPNSVTSIGEEAFAGCSSLSSISIPNSVTSIGGVAFAYCTSLTSITIPDRVTSIGGMAFEDCESLTSITCYATTPPVCDNDCFYDVDKSIPVYVPGGSIDAYKAANGWKDFTNIQAIATSLDQLTDSPVNRFTKIIKSGHLLILRDGKTYNVQGAEVR